MEGSIAHFLALIHTPYIMITNFIVIAISALKLRHPSTFHLACIKVREANSISQISIKILAKQSKTAKKCLHFNVV